MYIAGDIGGTKTALGLFDDNSQLVADKHFENAGYAEPMIIIDEFLAHCRAQGLIDISNPLQGMCLGVAGPVREQRCQMTNRPWHFDASEIAKHIGAPCSLINDLEAFARALPVMPASDFLELQDGATTGPVAIMSVGTGLGEALLLPHAGDFLVIPGEGGHKNFAPRDLHDANLLLQELKWQEHQHISAEHFLSGAGLVRLLFLTGGEGRLQEVRQDPDHAVHGATAVVLRRALEAPDSDYGEALRRMVSLMAQEAANIALQYGAEGGVVIGGGLPPRFAGWLAGGAFREHFCDKSAHRSWLRQLRVRLCINPCAPLFGAFQVARSANARQGLMQGHA